MAQLRAFTAAEEAALLALHGVPGESFRDVTRDRPSNYERLADKGLATVMLHKRQKRARLTASGRYFAALVAARAGERS